MKSCIIRFLLKEIEFNCNLFLHYLLLVYFAHVNKIIRIDGVYMYEPKSVCSGARLKATCQVPGELCGHATYYCFEKKLPIIFLSNNLTNHIYSFHVYIIYITILTSY